MTDRESGMLRIDHEIDELIAQKSAHWEETKAIFRGMRDSFMEDRLMSGDTLNGYIDKTA